MLALLLAVLTGLPGWEILWEPIGCIGKGCS